MLIFNCEEEFELIVRRNKYFEVISDWYSVLEQTNIFQQIQNFQSSIERRKFEFFVLKICLEKDLFFILEILLDRAILNK